MIPLDWLISFLVENAVIAVIAVVVQVLAIVVVAVVRGCDLETASAKVIEWKRRMNDRSTPRSAATNLAMIGGGLILLTAILVFIAMRSL